MWRKLIKRDRHEMHVFIHRHRRFQLVITFGTLLTASAAYAFPHYNELIVLGGTATNLIWIWE